MFEIDYASRTNRGSGPALAGSRLVRRAKPQDTTGTNWLRQGHEQIRASGIDSGPSVQRAATRYVWHLSLVNGVQEWPAGL